VKKLLAKLLQIRLAVAVIAVLGVAFVAFGFLVGMPPFAYIVIGLLIAAPTVLYVYKPRETALTDAKTLIVFFGATVATLLIIQFIPYGKDHSNPPVNGEPAWSSPRTRELMVNACFGCHSNSVEYPAYASVAPIDWRVGVNAVPSVGDKVDESTVIARVHAASEDAANIAEQRVRTAIAISESHVEPRPVLIA
jgi:hypothetical protein